MQQFPLNEIDRENNYKRYRKKAKKIIFVVRPVLKS